MTDREKKLAEIRKMVKSVMLEGWSKCPKQEILLNDMTFLLSELDREREENRKLREELDAKIAQNRALAKANVELVEHRYKLIEGLRSYSHGNNERHCWEKYEKANDGDDAPATSSKISALKYKPIRPPLTLGDSVGTK